tara:strand:+ start:3782 stop:4894 length:1113 start_codon:yes stop_codon:yes gene_type:complete
MKVGIIFAIYNCEEFVDECLEPWLKLRDSHNLILTCTSGRFKPYKDIGIKNKNQKTISKLVTKELDFISTTAGENLIDEDSSRNICLDFLKPHECDIIWLVDGDEFYTEKQIIDILKYVETNPQEEAFSLYFKNYTTNYPYFVKPWSRPTLYRNRLYGGINNFYFDSFFKFADGKHSIDDINMHQIPKHTAFIEHHSWTSREATIDKIKYQKVRYATYYDKNSNTTINVPEDGRCMCVNVGGEILLSKKFHLIRSVIMPSLHEYPGNKILDYVLFSYDRINNVLRIKTEIEIKDYNIIVRDLKTNKIYNQRSLTLGVGDPKNLYNHVIWFVPEADIFSESFEGYKIEILKDDKLLHIENIHTKLGIFHNC